MGNTFGHFVLSLFVLLGHSLYGQPGAPSSRLGLAMGAVHYRFMDEAYAHQPVIFRGTAFRPQLTYERLKDNHLFFVHASGGSANSYSQVRHMPAPDVIHVYLAAAYARSVASTRFLRTGGTLYAGAQIASSNYAIENIRGHDELTLSVYHTLNLFVYQRMAISPRNQLGISLSLPLAGLVKRQSYDGGINQEFEEQYRAGVLRLFTDGTTFSAISPLAVPQVTAEFVRSLSSKTDLVASYQFNYLRDNSIARIVLYSNTVLTGFRFRLNGAE